MTVLEVRRLTKNFGGQTILDRCSFAVPDGSVTGLVGPPGSGKTTVCNIVTGHLAADAGRVVFNGRTYSRPSATKLYRRGLCRTFQPSRVFGDLTALENVVVAARHPWRSLVSGRLLESDMSRASRLLREFDLAQFAETPARRLSTGQRTLLQFAAVLMGSPALVLLDEPTVGVPPMMVNTMVRHIRERNAAGVTFLVATRDVGLAIRLCDPIVVLDRGTTVAVGSPEAARMHPTLLDVYFRR